MKKLINIAIVVTLSITGLNAQYLNVSASSVTVASAAGSTGSFDISSDVSWSISHDGSWLSISPATGSNNATINITADNENVSTSPRTATITVTGTDVPEQTVTVTQEGADPYLDVSATSVTISSASGSEGTFDITSNVTWSITDDGSWLTVAPENGSNGGTITVTAGETNTSTSSRSATVTISGDGVSVRTVTVTQEGAVAYLDVSTTSVSIGSATGSEGTFNITSNVTWSIADNGSWLTVAPESGSDDGTITVTAGETNTSTSSRSATVTISGDGVSVRTVTVTQEGAVAYLDVSTTSVSIGSASGSEGTFDITANVTWSITDDGSWLSVSPTGGSNGATITVTAGSANPSTSARSATVTITGSGVSNQTVTVTQTGSAAYLNVSTTSVSIGSASGSSGTFDITSNVAWSITDDGSWLNVSPASGSNGATITVSASSANPSTSARSATVTITGSGVSNQTVTVTQAGSAAYLNVSTTSVSIGSASGSSGTFDITSNVAWSITDDGSWLNVSPTGGSNGATITVSAASANPSTSARSATVTITGSGVSNQTVTVTQAGSAAYLNVSTTSVSIGSVSGSDGTFNITSNITWNITDNASWLTVSPTSGSNGATITVTASETNPATTPRSATVTVTGSGVPNQTVTVTQAGSAAYLNVSTTSVSIGSASGSAGTFNITSNITWSITDNASWLTVSPTSGSNGATITVTASETNPATTPRSATVTVTGSGVPNQTVTVTQAGSAAYLNVSTTSISIGSASGSGGTFDITSNVTWSITDDGSWLNVSPTSGSNSATITVSAASANPSTSARSATVTITGSGVSNRTVTVTQAGSAAYLNVSTTSVSIGSESGSGGTFNITSNITWSITDNAAWLTVAPGSGSNGATITVTASETNQATTPRSATVTVTGSGVSNQMVTVTQAGSAAYLNVSATSVSIASASGASGTFDISSNISWSVADNTAWLTVSPASGSNGATITVTASETNPATTPRSATVTVSGSGVSNQIVTVTQAGSAAYLNVSATSVSIGSASGSGGTFNVTSNITWSISDNAAWLTVSPASGSNGATISVTASETNPATTPRSATVTLTGPGVSNQTVTVTQAGSAAYLNVSATSVQIGSASGASGTFDISSNISWTVADNSAWLTVSPASGSNGAAITVTASETNPATTARSATVTVSGSGVSNQIVTVTQAGSAAYLNVSATSVSIGSASGSGGTFNITSNIAWSITDNAAWLTVSPATDSNDATISVTASETNPATTARSATITVTGSGVSNQTVTVTQAGSAPYLNVSASSVTIESTSGASGVFSISSNTSWSVSDNASWLNVAPVNGSDASTISVSANSTNPATTVRSATVTITCSGVADRTVTVTQSGSAPYLYVSSSNLSIGPASGSSNTFNISSNISWSITDNAQWLSVAPSGGSNGALITVTAISENSATIPRNAEVTITANGVPEVKVAVIQSEVEEDFHLFDPEGIVLNTNDTIKINSPEAGSLSLRVESNIEWDVTDNSLWFSAAKSDSVTLGVTFLENISVVDKVSPLIIRTVYNTETLIYLLHRGRISHLNESKFEYVRMFPNPANDFVNLNFGKESFENIRILIIDLSGNTLFIRNCRYIESGQTIEIQTSGLPVGKYLVKISDQTGSRTFQMIKY